MNDKHGKYGYFGYAEDGSEEILRVRRHGRREPQGDPGPIKDTSRLLSDPLAALLFVDDARRGGVSEAIETMEKEGQRQLGHTGANNRAQLPADMGEQREAFKALGIVFLSERQEDKLFVPVQLPAGWKIAPTDHSMWSDLKDDKGRKRASIFYKAAFYDRSAHIHLNYRFRVETDYERERDNAEPYRRFLFVLDNATGKRRFETTVLVDKSLERDSREHRTARYKAEEDGRLLCVEWLKAAYPSYNDPSAHWDEP